MLTVRQIPMDCSKFHVTHDMISFVYRQRWMLMIGPQIKSFVEHRTQCFEKLWVIRNIRLWLTTASYDWSNSKPTWLCCNYVIQMSIWLICTRVSGSDKRFSDSWLHSGKNLFTDDVVLYYKKGLCRLLSGVCYITGRRKKGKGLVGLFKYNYYCGLTIDPALIWDLAFIIYIMLYPPTTKQDQTFIRGNTVYM